MNYNCNFFVSEFDLKIIPNFLLTYEMLQAWYEEILDQIPERVAAEQTTTRKLGNMVSQLLRDPTTSFITDVCGDSEAPVVEDSRTAFQNMENIRKNSPENMFLVFLQFITKIHAKISTKAQMNAGKFDLLNEEKINRDLKGIKRETSKFATKRDYQDKFMGTKTDPKSVNKTMNVATRAQKKALGIQTPTQTVNCMSL